MPATCQQRAASSTALDYGPTAHLENPSATSLGGPERRVSINPELPPDMGEFRRIREAPVCHHLPQSGHPRVREEEPRDLGRCIKTHQAAINQALSGRRQLRLALLRATWPHPELKALGHCGQRAEEPVELAADIPALAGREPSDGSGGCRGHGGTHSTSRLPRPRCMHDNATMGRHANTVIHDHRVLLAHWRSWNIQFPLLRYPCSSGQTLSRGPSPCGLREDTVTEKRHRRSHSRKQTPPARHKASQRTDDRHCRQNHD
jgi:hypothetical protein